MGGESCRLWRSGISTIAANKSKTGFTGTQSKNTAPCILYAAKTIAAIDPDAKLFIAPSDHLILNESQFIEDIQHGFEFINKHPEYLLTFGIHASRPDTGYGYINFDKEQGLDQTIYPVNRFVEKPDLKTAESYLESGDYVWNSGMFLWNVQTILNEFKQYAPTLYNLFEDFNQDSDISLLYYQCPSDSIDYAVMENLQTSRLKQLILAGLIWEPGVLYTKYWKKMNIIMQLLHLTIY